MTKPRQRTNLLQPLRCIAGLLICVLALSAQAGMNVPSGTYGLDKGHAYITFSYSHLGFSTPHVGFNEFDVVLELDADNPEKSRLNVTIDAASIDSRVDVFDDHLRGADYFDTEKHPQITFRATRIEMTSDLEAKVTGDLTIKGITQPLTLEATLNKAANHPMLKVPTLGISARGSLQRSAFDLGKYAPAVGDNIDIYITVELPKTKTE